MDSAEVAANHRRPTAQLSGAKVPAESPHLANVINRTSELRQRVLDTTGSLRAIADAIHGEEAESTDGDTSRPSPPVSGALGALYSEVSALEECMTGLERQSRRFRGIA